MGQWRVPPVLPVYEPLQQTLLKASKIQNRLFHILREIFVYEAEMDWDWEKHLHSVRTQLLLFSAKHP